jgi:DNA polymerase III epsilon subunit-like protein
MQHFNGNPCCVIDTETSGLDSTFHEILEIAIVPLDYNFEPWKGCLPFYLRMKPNHPERISPEAIRINKLDVAKCIANGVDQEAGSELLQEWIRKLNIPANKYGSPNRIMPLGQNYQFDKGFIQQWLGPATYDSMFHYHYRDTMVSALAMNDRAGYYAERIPFPKVNLQYLATTLGVKTLGAHNALHDALTTARVYQKLMKYREDWALPNGGALLPVPPELAVDDAQDQDYWNRLDQLARTNDTHVL